MAMATTAVSAGAGAEGFEQAVTPAMSAAVNAAPAAPRTVRAVTLCTSLFKIIRYCKLIAIMPDEIRK
ncbi:hypothetical protein ACFY15_28395 [Streptomyces sp. NPDC001373]|uniref:hypothetical protein n=1 Tax=Streptomyces sp. NPDC001373 TaxID=3364565 RepID=UPI00368DB97D